MSATLLGASCASLILVAAYRRRPLPRRPLPPAPNRLPATSATPGPSAGAVAAAEALGRVLIRLGRPRHSPEADAATARRAGTTAVAAAATALLMPALTPAIVLAGWAWPRWRDRRQERRRLARLEEGLPEVVDLLVVAVGAGANVSHAVAAAGRRGVGPLADELSRVSAEVRRGRRVADALDELPLRAGEPVRPVAAALAACERYGAPLGPTLELLGQEVRRQRQRRAEEAARKVPVLLLFPLVLCILPAFALLTVAPLVAGALRALRL